jgi:hypothetical protein
MKITKKHYELFKKECLLLMDKYQLNDYNVFFELKELENSDARTSSQICGNVTYALNNEIQPFQYDTNYFIKKLAKHEVIHCLIARFSILATSRFVSEEELNDEEEHLVRKLEKLL